MRALMAAFTPALLADAQFPLSCSSPACPGVEEGPVSCVPAGLQVPFDTLRPPWLLLART